MINIKSDMISIVLPVYNEAEGLPKLFEALKQALSTLDQSREVIFVDDGSSDESFSVLKAKAQQEQNVSVIKLKRNFGQTTALAAGIDAAKGGVIITMDSDLENDPADIPKLLSGIEEGYDIVSGNRVDRWKGSFQRRMFSRSANWLISFFSGVKLKDYGCTLKAYRREVFDYLKLYGEMHRMIPAYASWMGFKVKEVDVTFKPREFGQSHYSANRLFSVIIDLITLKFMQSFFTRPSHFFGKFGLLSIFLGGIAGGLAVYFKVIGDKDFIQTPLPVLMAFFVLMGVFMIFMGIFGEVLTRTYFESQKKVPYVIEERV